MPHWNVGAIDQTPTKSLAAWSAYSVRFDGPNEPCTVHLTGFRKEGCVGQVSSPVEVVDPSNWRVRTRSGTVYHLSQLPGLNGDAFALWGAFKARYRLDHEDDVTDSLAKLMMTLNTGFTQK